MDRAVNDGQFVHATGLNQTNREVEEAFADRLACDLGRFSIEISSGGRGGGRCVCDT